MEELEPIEEIYVNDLFNHQNVINEVVIGSQVDDEESDDGSETCSQEQETMFSDEEEENNDQNFGHSKKARRRDSLKKSWVSTNEARPRNESCCRTCEQKLNDYKLKLYDGHPNNALDESVVLIDEKLNLFNGDEENIIQNDMRATNKITSFSVYCRNGHLCSLDSGLIENEKNIYISGYVKPIYSDDPTNLEDAVPAKDLGPIVGWFVTGFDGSQNPTLAVSTALGEYFLMQPSKDYAPLMLSVKEKTFFSKIVIECLLVEPNTDYEDLLSKFETIPMPSELPRFSEDLLIYHAQFIYDQIVSFDQEAGPDDPLLINAPCVRTLINLAGVTYSNYGSNDKKKYQQTLDKEWRKGLAVYKHKNQPLTKATTTEAVHNLFEDFSPYELNKIADKLLIKRRRCGICKACFQIDCGTCANCKSMIKYGGTGTIQQPCIKRKCPNVKIVDQDYNEDEEYDEIMNKLKEKESSEIIWVRKPGNLGKVPHGEFYESVRINSKLIEKNDYIFLEPIDSNVCEMQVMKIKFLYKSNTGLEMLHGTWLWRGRDTILGETSHPRELFVVDECLCVPLTYVKSKANVIKHELFKNSTEKESLADLLKKDKTLLFYQKRYNHVAARFEDLLPDLEPSEDMKHSFCSPCTRDFLEIRNKSPQLFEVVEENDSTERIKYGLIKYLGEEYRIGSVVYLKPKTFVFKYSNNKKQPLTASKRGTIDEEKYPEFYRKSNNRIESSNQEIPEPYDIGYITGIYSENQSNLYLRVKKLYRPENAIKSDFLRFKYDLNMLYWSEEECNVRFNNVRGKCHLVYSKNLQESIQEWSAKGPDRFYFSETYDSQREDFNHPSPLACTMGIEKIETNGVERIEDYPKIKKKLRTLDVFAGCGGLSEGLKKSGVSENLWAVENDEAAAHAYRLNNPETSVFTVDSNKFLKKVLNGETSLNGQRLPRKGEVDLLCGGPPCSGSNHFDAKAYLSFKNSSIVTYLSFCDYYRPRFIIMENVENFVSFQKSAIIKLTLSCLVEMGYQCTFGILQAGSYGVPQSRRRLILLAAAPEEILPRMPSPLNVFDKLSCQLTVDIDNVKYRTLSDTYESAPYRAITVYDAILDLPKIRSGHADEEMQYENGPMTHFQRKMRSCENYDSILYDHSCKDFGPLVEARMKLIPKKPGSDWRDLPNIEVSLDDRTYTSKLKYKFNNKKSGKSSSGATRGVCGCCEGKPCDPRDKQVNTLIPWCLSHTADRHNQWAGLYGRLEWGGFFGTTNPEPMGTQGPVLHPEQDRVVSVRECARSKGFPDSFRFYGTIQDKHRQIGNAVPPPLAEAIGRELLKSVSLKMSQDA